MQNLIPNGSFEAGLSEWEATPSGVTLIKTETKRFVMLRAGSRSAAICSDPIPVKPGAAYVVEIERAMRGDCDIAVISPGSLLHPDHLGEVIPTEDKVRVQLTAKPGEKVGIAKVLLTPVGERLQIENVRSTAGFRKTGDPFEILCEVRNTGSKVVGSAVARLISTQHELVDEHRHDVPIAAIDVGGSHRLSWPVIKQRMALAPFTVEVEYSQGTIRATGSTLRHLPKPPTVNPTSAVATGRRWFSVTSRSLRLTAHETDLDYSPALLSTVFGTEIGIVPALAQIVLPGGSVVPLWSKIKQSAPGGVELTGRNEWIEWTIKVKADVATRGVGIELKAMGKKRLPGVRLELLGFQTMVPMTFANGVAKLDVAKESVRLAWSASMPRTDFALVASAESGLAVMRSEVFTLSPGLLRATANVSPADTAIVRT